jgi:hypothetical protein
MSFQNDESIAAGGVDNKMKRLILFFNEHDKPVEASSGND